MALSALAQPELDDDEADDYRLHEVWLHDFKSYAGAVRVGPFHPRLNVVVGPNGCGKSCLSTGCRSAAAPRGRPLHLPFNRRSNEHLACVRVDACRGPRRH